MAIKDLSPSGLRDFVKSLGWQSLPDGLADLQGM
jgi:hypothetical protein